MSLYLMCILGSLLVTSSSVAGQSFSYDGQRGPLHWGEEYNTCVGKHQSPINIEEHIVVNVSLPSLKFSGLDVSRSAYLTNNGHTVMLRLNDPETAQVSGGPLGQDPYVFEQLHFHWGENDSEGSEDKINNHSFAMELHVVFYKKSYGSMGAAVHNPDGLAVLAYFFEASEDDNPTYESIVKSLPSIENLDSNVKLPEDLIIDPILVPNYSLMQNYFTYNGSLTTPPCSEVVTWIDFKDPLPLSHAQIAAFRDVRTSEGSKLTHNFRPVQPLEDRVVYHNIVNDDKDANLSKNKTVESNTIAEAHSGQFQLDGSVVSTVAAFLLTFRSTLFPMMLEDIR
ncbi:carbonic anhydrase 2-like [Venturia canescens]|uniref:carbonic anhydrase 2-like n=1 Tax=Venturia canescens TaxID=32260 RepID=UPI001C9CB65F|nr:carbonic anhydrase 2-like [Venturia canescens]